MSYPTAKSIPMPLTDAEVFRRLKDYLGRVSRNPVRSRAMWRKTFEALDRWDPDSVNYEGPRHLPLGQEYDTD